VQRFRQPHSLARAIDRLGRVDHKQHEMRAAGTPHFVPQVARFR